MLQTLSIQNYALIDTLDITFDAGLTIITGETGAGKSIILGALALILGQRAESRYFFNQEKKCIIEGVFRIDAEAIKPLFEQYDLDYYSENSIRREISADGKSRAFINDTPVNLGVLKEIGEKLINIHSQHATLELHSRDFQLLIIDALAGHDDALKAYRSDFKQLKANAQQLEVLKRQAEEALARRDYEQFLLDELLEARIQADEQAALEKERDKLHYAETIKRHLLQSSGLLDGEQNSVALMLREALIALQTAAKHDTELEVFIERLRSCLIEVKDIAGTLEQMEQQTLWDGARLEQVQERLDLLYGLQQKHRVQDNAALLSIQARLEDHLSAMTQATDAITKLEERNQQLQASLNKQAALLSKNRKEAIPEAIAHLEATLQKLEIPHARVVFEQQRLSQTGKDGTDDIELRFSANAGQAPVPLNKTASGGELSRLMLAVKSLLAQHTALPTLIFDEIDTGISGETALKMGSVLQALGDNMQVIAITHLPQIAARGQSHYYVFKEGDAARSSTGIRKLVPQERVNAIAEMLSGKNPGAAAMQNAQALLGLEGF